MEGKRKTGTVRGKVESLGSNRNTVRLAQHVPWNHAEFRQAIDSQIRVDLFKRVRDLYNSLHSAMGNSATFIMLVLFLQNMLQMEQCEARTIKERGKWSYER